MPMEINLKNLTNASISFDDARLLNEIEHFDFFCKLFLGLFKGENQLGDFVKIKPSREFVINFEYADKLSTEKCLIVSTSKFSQNLLAIARDLYMSDSFEFEITTDVYIYQLCADPLYIAIKKK